MKICPVINMLKCIVTKEDSLDCFLFPWFVGKFLDCPFINRLKFISEVIVEIFTAFKELNCVEFDEFQINQKQVIMRKR